MPETSLLTFILVFLLFYLFIFFGFFANNNIVLLTHAYRIKR